MRDAKAGAFLAVPLFKAVYEKYKGGVIPASAELERDMANLGVSDKQKGRARQLFEKSAEEAGFFEHGNNRLVMPGVVTGPGAKQIDSAPIDDGNKPVDKGGGNGGIGMIETWIVARMKTDLAARRLATIPGIGPMIATRMAAVAPDPSVFRSGRDFAAWIGLVPRQNSSGGKSRLGGISKRGTAISGACGLAAPWRPCSVRKSGAPTPGFAGCAAASRRWLPRGAGQQDCRWAVLRRGAAFRPAGSSRPHEPGAVFAGVKTIPPSAVAFGRS